MTEINKITQIEGVSYDCKTLGELLDNFNVKLSYFMNEKKRSIPICSGRPAIFHEYHIMEYYENPLHVFRGKMDFHNIDLILDIRHQCIYSIESDDRVLTVKVYNFNGDLLKTIESDDACNIEGLIVKYVKRDYFCYTVGELLDAFDLDFKLSKKLMEHIIMEKDNQTCDYCCGHRIGFCDYQVKEISNRKLYVFESMFDNDTIVFDSEAPVYYIDPEREFLFVETKGMVGICILQFNKNNEIVKDAHSWIVDMEMFLQLTNNPDE